MLRNPLTSSSGALVIDANAAIALCSEEVPRDAQVQAELAAYAQQGYLWYAPRVIISETLYILCGKEQNGLLTHAEYEQAVADFKALMNSVFPPPHGDASLIVRADQIRAGYGCSRSADALYIALAEELSQTYPTRLLTYAQGMSKQAARHAPIVTVHLLT